MKIVCEACQAKYSIADEKVRGKVFKIRCKKCSHVIVVRGTGEVASASSGEFASSPSSAPDLALDAGWHIVVDGEQVGPLSEGDIRARLARAEITPDTYIWKEGLADWVKVGTLAEFKGGEAEASNPFATGEAGGPFGDVATQVNAAKVVDVLGASASAAAEREAPVPDLFASPAAEAGTGTGSYGGGGYGAGDLPAASDQYAASARGGGGNGSSGGGGGLTGQRHENSVLFSLSNLEALAKPSPSSLPVSARSGGGGGGGAGPGTSSTTTEGSGLIDIRAMANMTLGASAAARNEQRNNDLPAFSAPQFSPVAPVLLSPGAGGGTPRWAIGLAVVLGGLLVALTIVGFSLLTREDRPVEVAQPIAPPPPPLAPAPVAVAPGSAEKAAPPATQPPAANEDLPPREVKPAAAGAHAGDRQGPAGARTGARGGGARRGSTSRGGGSVAEVTDRSPTITPPSRPAEAAPKKPKDDIEALLEAASGGRSRSSGGGAAAAPRREEEPAAGGGSERAAPLAREDIVRGMNGVMPKGRECFAQYKVPGIANVKVTVAPSGRVTNGVVVGKFAGTPSGSCVESALKGAKFPASAGLTFDYFVPLK
jgi:predicted Zn finger-like uncharacterized protein